MEWSYEKRCSLASWRAYFVADRSKSHGRSVMPIAVIEIALEPSIVSDFVAGRLDQELSLSIARVVRHDAGLGCAISQALNVRKRVHQRLARRMRAQSTVAE